MDKLGYILSDKKIDKVSRMVGVVSNPDEIPDGSPRLIVGLKRAKASGLYKNILEKQLDDNTWWCFSRNESRSEFNEAIETFARMCLERVVAASNYFYVDLSKLNLSNARKLVYEAFHGKDIWAYEDGDMLYFTLGGNVFGIHLIVLEYIGVRREKLISVLQKNSGIRIVNGKKTSVFGLRRYANGRKYVIPLIFSKLPDIY